MENDNRISLVVAQGWATKWVDSQPQGAVKAHLIPMEDFVNIQKENGAVNVRAYIGIDENGLNKLMLVGVDANGRDMIDDTNGDYIYDFTLPCPNTCDTSSPLYIEKR